MNPTKKEKEYWDKLAELGCVVCRRHMNLINNYVSIHHINGRTKKGCHMQVLPLCFPHHQGIFGIHTMSRKVWERQFGKQTDLKNYCDKILEVI